MRDELDSRPAPDEVQALVCSAMRELGPEAPHFGKEFLWTLLARRA